MICHALHTHVVRSGIGGIRRAKTAETVRWRKRGPIWAVTHACRKPKSNGIAAERTWMFGMAGRGQPVTEYLPQNIHS